MKPVGMLDLFEDNRVQNIIDNTGGNSGNKPPDAPEDKKEGVNGGISYKHPDDLKPVLNRAGVPVAEDSTIRVHRIPSETVTITANPPAGISYTGFEWYCNDINLGESGNTITITAGFGPFDDLQIYQLVVIGIVDGIPYSTWIFIRVED